MKRIYYFAFFLILLSLVGCDQATKETKMQEVLLQGKTMGTTFTIKVFVPEQRVQELSLFSDVTSLLKDVNQSMSTYIPDSEINQFNRLAAHQNFPISEDFRRVTAESIRLGLSTKTLDVTMGPLIDLWGFGPDNRPESIPSDEVIAEIKQHMGVDKLKLSEHGLTKTVEGLEISYSATAKGFGIDKVAEYLDSLSLTNYMVEIGGEIRTSGHKPNNVPWVLAIEQPDSEPGTREFHKLIRVNDIAMATSGDYRIFYDVDGVHYSHLIHPETGKPVRQDLVSVTVLHASAMTADGLATALTIMGTEQAKQYAEQHNLAVYLISKTPKGLETYASNAFKPYL